MPDPQPLRWERILVPTDFSPFANGAVGYAHALAEKVNAELHVLHVVRDIGEAVAEHGAVGTLDPAGSQDEADQWLASLLGEAGTVRRVEALRVGDDVAATVVKYAKAHGIDLIVMATHGRTGLTHLLAGSVTEKVLRHAPCPLLAIRPTEEKS